jgi:hypothetical protein
MPFGKHKNQPLTDIPTSYLAWAVRTCDLSPWLREALERELKRRGVRPGSPPGDRPSATPVPWDALVSRWYGQLAMRWHPDRSGSTDGMKAINDARDLMQKLLREAAA